MIKSFYSEAVLKNLIVIFFVSVLDARRNTTAGYC